MSNHSRILHRRSAVSGTTPTQLSAGELAMNIHDGLLFVQNVSGGIESFSSDRYAPFVLDTELSACAPQYGGNTVTQIFSNVLGGYRNDVSGAGSSTVNGENNDIQGDFAFIGSGADNKILANGDFSAILGGRNNAISHQNSFTIGSNLSSHADNFTYVNNLSGILWGEGVNLRNLNASNISSGTLGVARLPAFSGDITTIAGTASATVVKLQGNTISTQPPSMGQMLQWSGTAWEPGSIPTGGSGGSGIAYYLNWGVTGTAPHGGLTGALYQLGRSATLTVPTTAVTFPNISLGSWDTLVGFVTDPADPYIAQLPAGIWDLNFWASSTASTQTQMMVRMQVYTYSDTLSTTTLVATSDSYNIYDPAVVAQYVLSTIVPQTVVDINSRIYTVIQAQGTSPNKDITLYFNANRPTHLHTSVPSVGGSGLVKTINGVFQTPASLLVDVDVASNAQIAQSKIYNLTTDLGNKLDKSGGTITGNLTVTGTFSTVNTELWQGTYTTVQNKSANWDVVYADFKRLSSTFLTSETDSQTISFVDTTKQLSISNGNTISLSALDLDTGVRSLTSSWDSTYSTVKSNSATSWRNSLSASVFADQTVGSITVGDTIPVGTTLQQFVEKLLTATFYPSFTNPSATLTSNLASIVESGTTGITLTVNYDRGAITGKTVNLIWQPTTFQDYRAGAATNYVINGTNNGTTSSYTDGSVVIADGSNSFTSTATYGTGPQPVDSKGANYSTALAGSTISPGLTVTGRRKAFYGVDSLANSSATIRSLGSSTLNPSNGTSFTISIPVGTTSVVFAYPSSLQDVSSVKESVLNAEIKSAFTQTTVSVQGANSYTGTNYKVYRYVPVEPFDSVATYTITI